MLRRGSRRAYRLVRVPVGGSVLNVFTGIGEMGATRARAGARTGAGTSVRELVKTARRAAFPLVAGASRVLTARHGGRRWP